MYSKDGRIQRKEVLEVKAFLAAREVILKAEKHPVVKAYLKALKFVEDQEKLAKAEDGPRSPPGMFANAKVVPAPVREPDVPTHTVLSRRFSKWRMTTLTMEKRMPQIQNKRKNRTILFICLL